VGIAVGSGLTNGANGQELSVGKRGYSFDEIDRKICREGKPDGLNKDDLPTPALILDGVIPHCDSTVNLYDRIYACRGERVEEVWSVMDRLS